MSPAQQLADALLDRRAAGVPFGPAWDASLAEVRWPADGAEAGQWRQALTWARAEFRDAYEHPAQAPRFVERTLRRSVDGMDAGALVQLAVARGDLRLLGAPVQP